MADAKQGAEKLMIKHQNKIANNFLHMHENKNIPHKC
jgi:hypothetical protein